MTATFIGFNTIGQQKKFTLTDFSLIKRDILNAFSIRAGTLPGRPEIGTTMWNFIFEPMSDQVRDAIDAEVRRVIDEDTRVKLHNVDISFNQNTVLIEIAIEILTNQTVENFALVFDQQIADVIMV